MASGSDRGGAETDPQDGSGGADAVQKTTYVTGQGTDPDQRTPPGVVARVEPGRGGNPLLWVAVAIAALVAIVYGLGFVG
ncbi:MAG: hypothetical protein ACYC2G_06120 [Gemmatimonadaceae bacterium]